MEERKPLNEERWLNDVRHTLADFSPAPPADVWERLAAETMPSESATTAPKPSQKKRRTMIFWLSTAAAAMLLIGLAILHQPATPEQPKLADAKQATPAKEKEETPAVSEENIPTEPFVSPVLKVERTLIAKSERREERIPEPEVSAVKEIAEISQNFENHEFDEIAENLECEEIPAAPTNPEVSERPTALKTYEPLAHSTPTPDRSSDGNSRWAVGVRMSSVFDADLGQDKDMFGDTTMSGSSPKDSTLNTRAFHAPLQRSAAGEGGNEKVVDSENHRLWSLGLAAQYQFADRWAVETGLVFSILTADVTVATESPATTLYTNSRQRIRYLGIPLKLNASLADTRYVNLYAAAGVMIERSVGASWDERSFAFSDWQFSLRANVGAEYKFSPQLSAFLEPGLIYYPAPDAAVPTYYSEHPFSFNLQLGLRVKIGQ